VGPEFVELKRLFVRGALVTAPLLILIAIAFPRAGAWLVVQDPLEKADAIFVLGGTMYERPLEAVDLYHAGWAPRIILPRQMADFGEAELVKRGIAYPREVDVQVDVLGRLGVPAPAIVIAAAADSTADEADHLYAEAMRDRLSRVIVVTSKQHTRRARLTMRRRLDGTGVTVIVRYSRYDRSDVDRWWARRGTLRFTLFEYQRLLGYWTGLAD
jgi:uncharacterized SAM-binding protein YcdF (DUF218 family)